MDKGWIRWILIEKYGNKRRQGTLRWRSKIRNLPPFGPCVAPLLIVVSCPSSGLSPVKKYPVWKCLRTSSGRRRTHRRGVRGERVRACRLKYYVPSFSAISARVLFLFLPSIFFPFTSDWQSPVGFGALEFIHSKSNRLPFRIQETLLEHGIVLRFSPSLRWTDSLPK